MPVDQATLERYITDIAGDDQDLATLLREKLGTKEQAASRFVGGFLRNQDYTQKTQDLARQRQQTEALTQDYEQRLTQAEGEKDQIMRDLANERLTASKAQAMLKTVKQAYALTDADLPGIDDVQATARTGRVVDSTPDLDERLNKFEAQMMDKLSKRLIPEISALAMLGPVWNSIEREHQRLFNKELDKKEEGELLKQARDENRSLESVWQERYNVSDRRLEVRDKDLEVKLRHKWDDEQAKKNQEAALRGVNPESREYALEDRQSPLFKRSFMPKESDSNSNNQGTPPAAASAHTDASRERLGAADRAAAKFLERARNGQLGKPLATERVPA